jgi:hypothetical protein
MTKQDLDLLAKFWQDIEQNYYHKASHLANHFIEWTRVHGPLPDTHEHFPVINRMLDAAALYKEDCEHE